MRKVYKDRLLKLARLLMANAKNKKGVKFDLTSWGSVEDVGGKTDMSKPVKMDCGTTACAAGLAAISGQFKGLGYKTILWGHNTLQVDPTFRDYDGFNAITVYFGLNSEQGQRLFSPDFYPRKYRTKAKGEKHVAERIRYFVRKGTFPKDANRLY
jgi:hypothetical protein